jgi:importin-5
MGGLLDIVIEVIKQDEQQGQESLESLMELTSSFGELWKDSVKKLIFVCSEVMKNKEFEDKTRQSALELLSSVAEGTPKLLKDNQEEMKTQFYPALMVMITCLPLEDDLADWLKEDEEERNDISSRASETLNALAEHLGEKMTIACTTQLINELVKNESWQCKVAGYVALGMISETCQKSFKSNLEEILKMISPGILDAHIRVRFEALEALTLLCNDQSPHL